MSIDLGVKIAWAEALLEINIQGMKNEDLLRYKWQLEITIDLVRHNVWICLWRKDTSPRLFLQAHQSIWAIENKLLEIQKILP